MTATKKPRSTPRPAAKAVKPAKPVRTAVEVSIKLRLTSERAVSASAVRAAVLSAIDSGLAEQLRRALNVKAKGGIAACEVSSVRALGGSAPQARPAPSAAATTPAPTSNGEAAG